MSNFDLLQTARALQLAGFHIRPFRAHKASALPAGFLDTHSTAETDAETISCITRGQASGLGVLVGPDAVITDAYGKHFLPVVLEHEGRASSLADWDARWDEAVAEYDAASIMAKMRDGWVEASPSGGVHWLALVEVPTDDPAVVKSFLSALPCVAVQRTVDASILPESSGEPGAKTLTTLAELLVDPRAVIVAPSGGETHPSGKAWERMHGGPEDCAVLDWSELLVISDLLASLTETPATAPSVPLNATTAKTLSMLDRTGTPEKAQALLEEAGWTVGSTRADGEVYLTKNGHAEARVGGPFRQRGQVTSFSTSFPLHDADGRTFFRFSELLVTFGHEGDADAAAADAVSEGVVDLPVAPLAPKQRVEVTPESSTTTELATSITRALVRATGPTGIPFVIAEEAGNGAFSGFVTVTASRDVRHWTAKENELLCLTAVQPVRHGKLGVTQLHRLDPSVTQLALMTVEEAAPRARFIANAPILLPTGKALSEDGWYPKESALIAIPAREVALWEDYCVPGVITHEDAQEAADFLATELLSDFPFEAENDRARALAYLLTCATRDLYSCAPGYLFTAPDRGSGKDLLASLGRIIAQGSVGFASVSDPSQTERTMVSAQLAGQRFLHNAEIRREQDWRDDALQSLITSGVEEHRQLGVNKLIPVSGRIITGCGNNATISSDLVRRFLPIRLHYLGQGPAFSRTTFRHSNLQLWASQNRARLLAACHCVIGYGLQQQTEFTAAGFGGFEQWVRTVLGGLSHVELDGRSASDLATADRMHWVEDADTEGMEWAELMQAWHEAAPNEWMSASSVMNVATTKLKNASGEDVGLPTALLNITGASARSNAMQWANVLKSRVHTRVLVDGVTYWVEQQQWKGSAAKYRVASDGAPSSTVTNLVAEIEEAATAF